MPREAAREIGSEFHWDPAALTGTGGAWLPARYELFATACGALTALLRQLAPRGHLHMPSYFCMGVAEALSTDIPIAWYRHLPDGRGPRWDTLRVAAGDLVLAQNLFGRDDGARWAGWIRAHPGVTVVEDHSHDPLSRWARTSTAPYAVASLRKTLPLPDGGLLWSPRGLDLPRPAGGECPGAPLKLAAMLLKAAWLEGRTVPKEVFRELQQRGERTLLGSAAQASALTAAALSLLDAAGLREIGDRNVRALATALPAATADWRLLAAGSAGSAWAAGGSVGAAGGSVGAAPFRAQLLCASEAVRDALQVHLAAHRIFAPVHWRQDRTGLWSGDEEAAGFASRLLTVPVDHRCGPADVRRIADVVAGFRLPVGAGTGPAVTEPA